MLCYVSLLCNSNEYGIIPRAEEAWWFANSWNRYCIHNGWWNGHKYDLSSLRNVIKEFFDTYQFISDGISIRRLIIKPLHTNYINQCLFSRVWARRYIPTN